MTNYSSVNASFEFPRRQRRLFTIILLICIITTFFFIIHAFNLMNLNRKNYNEYMEDFSKENYDYVIERWYNFSTDDVWYNKKNISMDDSNLLDEMRVNWIIKESNTNYTYYRGLRDPLVVDPSMGQAAAIKEIFNNKKNGFFIECGAYDGETRSNTLTLERYLNWTGILIEADPKNFVKMLEKKRRAYLSPACLSIEPKPMRASFLMADNIGRIHTDEDTNEKLENSPDVAHHGTHVTVQCFPLLSYIAAFNFRTIDYLSLDVEGNEMDILKTIPFNRVDIKTLSVEYSHVNTGRDIMIKFMEDRGYYVHSFVTHPLNLANDIIFVKK